VCDNVNYEKLVLCESGVVIVTMFAAETFDPRLMWDAAAEREQAVGVTN
jgi:uncharacterized paraquat-inducible protein A